MVLDKKKNHGLKMHLKLFQAFSANVALCFFFSDKIKGWGSNTKKMTIRNLL